MRFLIYLCFLLLLPSVGWAQLPAIPGDGIDTALQTGGIAAGTKGSCPAGYADAVIGDGCTLLFPDTVDDRDNDGYASDDCDDTNRRIYPGRYTTDGCSAGEHRQCQSDGTYSACTSSTLAECGTNYYFDAVAGDDANAGTYAAPFKTLGKVSGGASGASGLPAGAITLSGDTCLYLLDGDFSTSIGVSIGGSASEAILASTSTATSGAPIRVRNYPGSDARITSSDGVAIFLESAEHWRLEDLEIAANATTTDGTAVMLSITSHIYLENVYITAPDLDGDNNESCIYASHTDHTQITNSFLYNCKRRTGNVFNVDFVKWLDDAGETPARGAGHKLVNTVMWQDTFDATNGGICFRQKHGIGADTAGPDGHVVKNNYCLNSWMFMQWDSSHLRATCNFAHTDGGTAEIAYINFGGESSPPRPHIDNLFQYNTFVNAQKMQWRITAGQTIDGREQITFKDNIVTNSVSSWGDGGMVVIDTYGPNENKDAVENIAYHFAYDAESGGPFTLGETLTFGNGATAVLWGLRDLGTTGFMGVGTITGSVPSDNGSISGGTSSASAAIDGSVTATDGLFLADNNTYHNSNSSYQWGWFAANDLAVRDEGSWETTLSGWRTASSVDASSVTTDPAFDAYFTSSAVSGGWRDPECLATVAPAAAAVASGGYIAGYHY